MIDLNKKQINIVVAIVAVFVFGIWDFYIVPSRQKGQEYTGTITETHKSRKWFRGRGSRMTGNQYRNFTYYWRIKTDDGDTIDAEVPFHSWNRGKAGTPVKKMKGYRWPVVNTREAEEARKNKKKALDMVFGN